MLKSLYLSPKGRINRKTYFFLGFIPHLLLIGNIFSIFPPSSALGPMSAFYVLILHWPITVMSIKRAHDQAYSGWYLLLMLFPLVNFVVMFFLLVSKGDSHTNDFGDTPLQWRPR